MKIFEVEIEKLDVPENNRLYSQLDIDLMQKSIEIAGILAPVVVVHNIHTDRYRILDGVRRYKALKQLGFTTVPCTISCDPENVRAALQMVEGK